MSKRFLLTLITALVIFAAAGIAIFFAKGYTFSPSQRMIVGTGIISVASKPDSASVFIDGHLTTATNATISSLTPRKYTVKIIKEGFIPWEKTVEVKEGLVTELKVTLFPSIPTIYPLTFSGVKNPILSADGSKLAYVVPTSTASGSLTKKAGVWVWEMVSDRPIAFARGAEPHQIAISSSIDYSNAKLRWSADSKQVLANVGANNYLLNDDRLNSEPRDITPVLDTTLKSWGDDIKVKETARIVSLTDGNDRKVASDSAMVKWSPDELKFMYGSKEDDLKVYDTEDNQSYTLPSAKQHLWLPDSQHLILVEEDKVSVVDFDGSNKAVIFAGNFLDSFVFAWPDSSRIVIISSLPTPTASEPNLYGINLK